MAFPLIKNSSALKICQLSNSFGSWLIRLQQKLPWLWAFKDFLLWRFLTRFRPYLFFGRWILVFLRWGVFRIPFRLKLFCCFWDAVRKFPGISFGWIVFLSDLTIFLFYPDFFQVFFFFISGFLSSLFQDLRPLYSKIFVLVYYKNYALFIFRTIVFIYFRIYVLFISRPSSLFYFRIF